MIGSYTNIGGNITICCTMTLNWHMKLTKHWNFTIQENSKLFKYYFGDIYYLLVNNYQ